MGRNGTRYLVGGAVVVGLLGIGLLVFARRPETPAAAVVADAVRAERAAPAGGRLAGGADETKGRMSAEVEQDAAARPELPAPPDDLADQLRRVARAEEAVFAAGAEPPEALRVALEEALAPLLFHPETMPRILDLLRAGALRVRIDHLPAEERAHQDARLGPAEYGAVRTLYWALLTYHAPYGVLHDAGVTGDAEALLLDVLLALPDIEHPVRGQLLTMLTQARLDEVLVLGPAHLGTILRLRALFPAHESVFSALLVSLGEGMDPEERTAFFRVFLPETDDPILMGVTLRNLLQGADPEFARWLAAARFDDAAATREMRAAIAAAVVDGVDDPFVAVEFLSARAQETAAMPALYLTLGWRGEDARTAIDTKYTHLLLDGADPEARRLLVMGMGEASPARLLEIARDDPDPRVRGQALVTMTAAPDREPTREEVRALREAYTGADNGIGVGQAMAAASNLARRARANGREELKGEVVSFLLGLAEDPNLSGADRRGALEELKGYVDELRRAGLAEEIGRQERGGTK